MLSLFPEVAGNDRRCDWQMVFASSLCEQGAMEVFGDMRAGAQAPCVTMLHYFGPGSPGGGEFLTEVFSCPFAGLFCCRIIVLYS